jgi:hypothetical protein
LEDLARLPALDSSRSEARELRTTLAAVVVLFAGAVTWLTLSADEKNLIAARNGAQVIKYTSELGGEWRADNLIDEKPTSAGWASADRAMPQEIIFRLPAVSRFNTLVFNPRSDAPDSQWARDISVYTADPFPCSSPGIRWTRSSPWLLWMGASFAW